MSELCIGRQVHIQAKRVNADELRNLIDQLHQGNGFRYIMVAWWDCIVFDWFDALKDDELQRSEWGRAFGENAEVCWRKDEDGQGFLVRWIFEGRQPPEITNATQFDEQQKRVQGEERAFLLWGAPYWEEKQWKQDGKGRRICYTARIPRLLEYPIDDDLANQWKSPGDLTPLVLKVRVYLGENGQPIFERFIGLERYDSAKVKATGGAQP